MALTGKDDFTIPLIVARLVKDRQCYSAAAIGYLHPAAIRAADKEIQILEPMRPIDQDYDKALVECMEMATTWITCGIAEAVVIVYHDKVSLGDGKKPKILGYMVPTGSKTDKKTSARKIVKSYYQFKDFPP